MASTLATTLEELAKALNGTVHRVDWDIKVLPDQRVVYTGLPPAANRGDIGPSVTGKLRGRSTSIELEPMGNMVIKLGCTTTRWFRIVPNSFLAQLDLFSGRRVLSGIKDFDDAFIVRGDSSQEFAVWLSSAEIRDSIVRLAPLIYLILQRGLLRYRSEFDLGQPDSARVLHKAECLDSLAVSVESLP